MPAGWVQPLMVLRSPLETLSNKTARVPTAQSQPGMPQEAKDWTLAAQASRGIRGLGLHFWA